MKTIEQIAEDVANYYGVSLARMTSNDHHALPSRARAMAMHFVYEMTPRSNADVGEFFGCRRESVGKARSRLLDLASVDHRVRKEMNELSERLEA